jgi:DNA-binding NtrC family response regulator
LRRVTSFPDRDDPMSDDSPPDPEPDPGAAAHPAPRAVLLVEDDEGVRYFVRQVLEQAGFAVLAAAGADEAARLFRADPGRIDLVLTDVVMPGRTGPELVAELRSARPGLPVLFMSGFTGGHANNGCPLPPAAALLEKPFGPDLLLQAVTAALDAAPRLG